MTAWCLCVTKLLDGVCLLRSLYCDNASCIKLDMYKKKLKTEDTLVIFDNRLNLHVLSCDN